MVDVIKEAAARPSRQGIGGRYYVGPKAQTTVDEQLFAVVEREATARGLPMTAVWREVVYAGLLATRRASRTQIEAACEVVGIDCSGNIGEIGQA
jgi:hypothetical protein